MIDPCCGRSRDITTRATERTDRTENKVHVCPGESQSQSNQYPRKSINRLRSSSSSVYLPPMTRPTNLAKFSEILLSVSATDDQLRR